MTRTTSGRSFPLSLPVPDFVLLQAAAQRLKRSPSQLVEGWIQPQLVALREAAAMPPSPENSSETSGISA